MVVIGDTLDNRLRVGRKERVQLMIRYNSIMTSISSMIMLWVNHSSWSVLGLDHIMKEVS